MVPLMALAGCAAPGVPTVPVPADNRPPIARCEAVRDIDWRRFDPWASRWGPEASTSEPERVEIIAREGALLEGIGKAQTPHRPSPQALIVIRAYVPPAGHHAAMEYHGMTWREPDGQWWVWSQWIDRLQPPPPPPPPPRPGEPEPEPAPSTWDERFPPVSGPVSGEVAARLEAAWSDPCRVWEPDRMPWAIPLLRRDPATRSRLRECPRGGAPILGDIVEAGQPPRLISYPCNMAFSTDKLLTSTAFARPAENPQDQPTSLSGPGSDVAVEPL